MTAPLSLARLRPDMTAFSAWAIARGFLPPRVDTGYALHAALKAALGDAAPQPFVLRGSAGQPGARELLGYVPMPAHAILSAAACPPVHAPEVAAVLRLGDIEASEMPESWREGGHWSFEIRVRPVIRSRPDGRSGKTSEIDVNFWARTKRDAAATMSRSDIYAEWFANRLEHSAAAKPLSINVESMNSVHVLRRPATGNGQRGSVSVPGPDVLLRGELEVTGATAFRELLGRGVGRHRAFGFGCLLLAPPGVF